MKWRSPPTQLGYSFGLLFALLCSSSATQAQLAVQSPRPLPDSKLSSWNRDYGMGSFARSDFSLNSQSLLQSKPRDAGDGTTAFVGSGYRTADKVCRPEADPRAKASRVKIIPAMWQSFQFLSIQLGVDLAMDPIERGKLVNAIDQGQFWSRYWKTLQNFRYNHYSDDDSIKTTYIGHPMMGAETEFIWIQNNPRYSEIEFANTKSYWKSRLWATIPQQFTVSNGCLDH